MSRPRFVRTLSRAERAELEAVCQTDGREDLKKRCEAILKSAQGEKTRAIAEALKVDNATVHRWLDRYEARGLAGLRTLPRSGRPPVWDEAYEYELVELVRHDPRWWGWPQPEWTASLLAEHLARRRGIRLGAERVRELLSQHGVRLKGAETGEEL